DQHSTFRGMGCDSLAAVELRNRITAATGLRLPATMAYDHPTPVAVAKYIRAKLATNNEPPASVSPVTGDDATPAAGGNKPMPAAPRSSPSIAERISTATNEELFRLIDADLRMSPREARNGTPDERERETR